MNKNETNTESDDEKFWLAARRAALALFEVVPEELRTARPDASRWLRIRDAAVLAWSALPNELKVTAAELEESR
jgi:hypothetical protein